MLDAVVVLSFTTSKMCVICTKKNLPVDALSSLGFLWQLFQILTAENTKTKLF